ncbi:Alpha-elapitoxin-Lh2a [Bienertia sinuspersici]
MLKFQERSKRNIVNRRKLTMCHYAGSKSFARIRAEKKVVTKGSSLLFFSQITSKDDNKKDGKEPDPLAVWLDTHQPKKGSRLDEASAATKKLIEDDLACHTLDSCNDEERMKIFKKHVGEDKNGYAKTFGLGVKVPRSRAKRCALEEERSKRIKSEKKVEKMEMKLKKVTTLMKKFLILQGMSDDLCLSDDDEEEEDGASYEKTGEENLEKENLGNESEEDVSCRLEPQDDYLEDEQMV